MNDFGEKIMIAFISATIALYLKYWYDQHLADKRVNEFRKSIIKVIELRLIPKYHLISKDYKNLYNEIEHYNIGNTLNIKIESYSLEENDLRDIFPLEDILKVFNQNKKNNYNVILQIEDYIKVLNRFSPEKLIREFIEELDQKDSITQDKLDCKTYYKKEYQTYLEYSNQIIKYYTAILIELKEKQIYE